MIVEQIKYGYKVFGKDLEVYQDNKIFGRQYYLPTVSGILDLLLVERGSNTLYVVELKRNEAGIGVVEQIERYILGLGHLFIDRDIKGIICLHTPDTNLVELVKTKPNIELFKYEFNFNRLK
nr:endonuclease NucS domain-containing protein [Panacibacter microcysteis]